jgi:signal transduction histidine kinase
VSIRTRLTLSFVAAMAVLVLITSTATYLIVARQLRSQAGRTARTLAATAASTEPEELSLDRLVGPGDRIWLTDGEGGVVASSFSAGRPSAAQLAAILRSPGDDASVAEAARPDGGRAIVVLANREMRDTLSTLARTLTLVGLGILVAAALIGWWLAARALRPVDRMREEVDAIPGDALDRRIAGGRADELGRLARAFNRLLARAEQAVEEQQRFVADASHELKTPVTALQGHARILGRAVERGDREQARESADVVAQQSARLAVTLGELLSLAEAGGAEPLQTPVRLDRIVEDACEEMRALDPERALRADLAEVTVTGDAKRLGELVRILVDNALKYSPSAEPVDVSLRDGVQPTLAVRDSGAGLTGDDRARAFDRFFRGSASAGVNGSGLGLSIARAICERHGARLELEPASPHGTIARVRFPAA